MIVAYYMFLKVLVGKMFLQPELYAGMKMQSTPNIKLNLKIIASVISSLIKSFFKKKIQLTNTHNLVSEADSNLDGLEDYLFSEKDIMPFLSNCEPEWINT